MIKRRWMGQNINQEIEVVVLHLVLSRKNVEGCRSKRIKAVPSGGDQKFPYSSYWRATKSFQTRSHFQAACSL